MQVLRSKGILALAWAVKFVGLALAQERFVRFGQVVS